MVFDFFKGATKEGYLSNSEEEGMDASLQKRIKRTLYGGVKVPECFNLGFSDIAVDYFQEAVPRNLRDLQRGFPAPLAQHACVSPCSVLLSMIYTKRLCQKNPEYLLQISSSDLFFISMMVASKYLYNEDEDDDVLVDEWAEDMDREKDEVIELERSFLAAIEWHLFVKQDEFEATLKDMERQMALRAGLDRGWLTYNELQLLAPSPAQLVWSEVGTHWVQVVVVSSVAYLAGVMTMVGSTALAIHSPALASSAAMAMSASLPALREGLHQLPVFGSGLKSPPSPLPLPPLSAPPLPEVHELVPEEGGREDIWTPTFEDFTWGGSDAREEEDDDGINLSSVGLPNASSQDGSGNCSSARKSGHCGSPRRKSALTMEALLRRLWSLLTLKNTLIQFMSAAADEYAAQTLPTGNQASRKHATHRKRETEKLASPHSDDSTTSSNSGLESLESRLSWSCLDCRQGANVEEMDRFVDNALRSEADTYAKPQCLNTGQELKLPENLNVGRGSKDPGWSRHGLADKKYQSEWCHWGLEVPLPEPEDFTEWSRGFTTGSFHQFPVAA